MRGKWLVDQAAVVAGAAVVVGGGRGKAAGDTAAPGFPLDEAVYRLLAV